MDFTGINTIKHEYSLNVLTGVITITFKDGSDVEIGTMTIEKAKYRPFMEVLHTMSREFYGEYSTGLLRTSSNLYLNDGKAVSNFFV